MGDVYFTTELQNGIPQFKAATDKDRKALDNFRIGCDSGQLVKASFEKTSQREFDANNINAHYFAYLNEWLSEFDFQRYFSDTFSIPLKSISYQVDALHNQLKSMSLTVMPELLRVIRDKNGNDTYHFFSLEITDAKKSPFALTMRERKKYTDWVFEFAMKLQEEKTGRYIPAWDESN